MLIFLLELFLCLDLLLWFRNGLVWVYSLERRLLYGHLFHVWNRLVLIGRFLCLSFVFKSDVVNIFISIKTLGDGLGHLVRVFGRQRESLCNFCENIFRNQVLSIGCEFSLQLDVLSNSVNLEQLCLDLR